MRTYRPTRLAFALCLASGTMLRPAMAETPNRVAERVDDNQRFTLTASVHSKTRIASDLGPADANLSLPAITIHLAISPVQQAKLEKLLQEQQDKTSPQFHKWLTPEQFGQQFGASQQDAQRVKQWLQENGFQNVRIARGRTFVTASGTVAAAEAAFETSLHMYRLPSESEVHYANAISATLPRAFEPLVQGISGLNDFRPKPRALRQRPRLTSDQTGNHFLVPADFATIYDLSPLYSASPAIDGTGVKIAIPGQTDIDVSNVATFRSLAGLSANPIQVTNLSGHKISSADQGEAYLDVEWAGAVAKGATILYINGPDVGTAESYIIDNQLAPVMSITYGLCEAQANNGAAPDNTGFAQASAQGMTVVAAAGDYGPADCDEPTSSKANPPTQASQGLAVDFPGSSPNVTAAGGTEFVDAVGSVPCTSSTDPYWSCTNSAAGESALSYIPESVWNETTADGNIFGAGGGGASKFFTKPSWQTGSGVPSDGQRDVPDIALNTALNSDAVVTCAGTYQDPTTGKTVTDCVGTGTNGNGFRAADSSFDIVGGTSVSAPEFAGIVALLVQENGQQGNINQQLYLLAANSTDAFHDITTGTNAVACKSGSPDCPSSGKMGYAATAGYDQASGLGSIDAAHLVDEWNPDFSISLNPTSLTVGAGASGTSTLTVSKIGAFTTSSVTLTCAVSAALTNTSCTVPDTATVGGTGTITIKNGNSSHILPWRRPWMRRTPGAFWPLLILALTAGMLAFLPRSRRRVLKGAFATGCFALALGCGGGSSGSPGGSGPTSITGSVTITATGGGKSHPVTLTVTDQ